MAIVILLGRWLDLYILVMPGTFGESPLIGIWELGPITGALGVFFWLVFRKFRSHNPLPSKDPYLQESLQLGHH